MPVCTLADLPALLKKDQCLLGLDPGSVVIGVAISDPAFSVASPLTSIPRKKFSDDAAAIVRIMRERNIGALIIGLPKNMDGSEGPAAQSARALARNLLASDILPEDDMPMVFWDERLSSAAVERFLVEDDMSRKRRDEVIDKAAAAWILQGALDALRNSSK